MRITNQVHLTWEKLKRSGLFLMRYKEGAFWISDAPPNMLSYMLQQKEVIRGQSVQKYYEAEDQ